MANNNYDIDILDIIKRTVTKYKLYRATTFFRIRIESSDHEAFEFI